ncbi:MAG: ABC transporter permease [Anaerofustis sp.]
MVKFFKRTYLFLILFFLYAPIVVLAVYSFNASRTSKVWGGFSLQWYVSLFHNGQIMTALYYTLLVAGLACVISTLVGTVSAIGIYTMKDRSKKLLLNVNYLPVINPDIVTGISLMLVFSVFTIQAGLVTMLIAHITFCIPYVILSVLPKLKQMDRHLVEAAMDLGATPLYTLRHIIIPEIKPGIVTGALLAFTLSIDDFVISFFNTGGGVTNLSIYIYSAAKRGISPEINALSTIMILTVTLLLIVINRRADKTQTEKGDR